MHKQIKVEMPEPDRKVRLENKEDVMKLVKEERKTRAVLVYAIDELNT